MRGGWSTLSASSASCVARPAHRPRMPHPTRARRPRHPRMACSRVCARSGADDVEHIILFAGPMGAGKTTAIQSLSDIRVIATEAANSDREQSDKPTTTVALDYGEIHV